MTTTDFTTVTETPGARLSKHGMAMLCHRYRTALDHCAGKDVLEVACGAGQGLGYLARQAKRVVGGDCTPHLVQIARQHYKERILVSELDAHHLDLPERSFDVVILFEALYYLASPQKFLQECRRVLRPGGIVLISTINREWEDFNPSPFSTKYHSARELSELLREQRFQPELFGAFPVGGGSLRDAVVSLVKRAAVALHLVPKTMGGKEFLKRIFFGSLIPLPPELGPDMPDYEPPAPVPGDAPCPQFRVIYAVGRLGAS